MYFRTLISIFSITLAVALNAKSCAGDNVPLIVVTWAFNNAAEKGWDVLQNEKRSALDAVEAACTTCEDQQCYKTVGYGGNPDESGETTLDAMIMDGTTMDVGAVAGLRSIKNANSVARKVLENTQHSLLAGSLATDFAEKMGFKRESLQTDESKDLWLKWKDNNCQPNFWKNVVPDSRSGCGPYQANHTAKVNSANVLEVNENNHDTIGVIAIDINGNIASGTSTNGLLHKIPGRVGDTPIPGAGSYADQEVGAAAATGQGDIMMRFLPSFLAVEEMRRGANPTDAARTAIERIRLRYPSFGGAIIALNKYGQYGVACYGPNRFPFFVANQELGNATAMFAECSYLSDDTLSKGISVSGFTTPKPDLL